MKYNIVISKRCKTQLKKYENHKKEIMNIVNKLANGEKLEPCYLDHPLKGNYKGFRECHIKPDLLLVYRIYKQELELYVFGIGSHNELFK